YCRGHRRRRRTPGPHAGGGCTRSCRRRAPQPAAGLIPSRWSPLSRAHVSPGHGRRCARTVRGRTPVSTLRDGDGALHGGEVNGAHEGIAAGLAELDLPLGAAGKVRVVQIRVIGEGHVVEDRTRVVELEDAAHLHGDGGWRELEGI